ncbi:GntR family transcriptional regulator [Azospirillum sp. YIM B02556]|uniref:GntR family transcriptional regulator n=1 Tax=Azospirillum endophyticum TaxID=2800326 RepID=A0ABS1F4T6_9PROT|nr:GntR family transcriptional regulator [Azospirillum endophyticum]MBK1838411.1 GntR family transcriptional regulator [Azospirillum endophyticum]
MSKKPVISRVALADQVMHLLQERILDGEYEPGGRLNIDAISRELDISSSPIREALTRLSAMGLVTSSTFAGFAVTPVPTRKWFEQLLTFRVLAEGWAVRQVARLRPAGAIERMTDSLRALESSTLGVRAREYVSASKADENFHDAMLDACGNEVLAQSVRSLHPHLHHARLFSTVPQDIAPVIEEHRAILNAVLSGDEDAAAAALERHLRMSWQRYDGWTSGETTMPDA